MKKSEVNNIMIVSPESPCDIEDLVMNLQEREMSVLVNMSKCKIGSKAMDLVLDYVLCGTRSYMSINVKRIFPKVFVCFSKRQKF